MIDAHKTFLAMTTGERHNLAKVNYWLDPDANHKRGPGDHLIGPEYQALIGRGVIVQVPTPEAGKPVVVTDFGRAVLHYIEGGL